MKYSNKILKIIFYPILLSFLFYSPNESLSGNESITLENFEGYSGSSNIFDLWLLREGDRKEASNEYKINIENNNKFLHATSLRSSLQIAKKVTWDIHSFPEISWRWRASVLPENANEDAAGRNDSAASVYVIFQRKRIPFLPWDTQPINVIKYIWSTSLPKGTVVHKDKKRAGTVIYEGYFIVIESGADNLGKWITEKRNVLEDYKKVFGKAPKYNPYLIAILTDSNNTGSKAEADYDDIEIRKAIEEK